VQGTVDFELSSLGQFAVQLAGTAAALDLDTGIVPFALVLMLVFIPASRSHRMHWADDETRSLTAVTVSLTAALALISSFYLVVVGAPWRPAVPSDRYVFYVVPLFLILFLRWIEHGAPRDGLRWVAATAAALPLAVAATEIHGRGFLASGSALSFMPWMFIRALSPSPSWLIGLGAFCCLFAVSASTERIGVGWLVRLVVASGLTLTISAFGYAALGSWNATLHSPPAQWLDLRTDAPVVGVWVDRPTARQTFALWSVAMMNRNLHRVYYVRQPDQLGSESRLIEGPGGELLENGKAMYPRYVLTASTTPLIGRLIAQRSGLALYRVRPPLRLAVAQRFGASSAQP
jgi:hypothetical protein